MIQMMKKQGLKAALPLLLLATACGDGTSSPTQFDAAVPQSFDAAVKTVAADTSDYEGLAPLGESLKVAEATTTAKKDLAVQVVVPADVADAEPKKVPEPTALAGLAIITLGLGAIKRNQSA